MMNSLENSTKIPISILKFFGLWDFQISNKRSLNFFYLFYKVFSILSFACVIYRSVNLLDFQKEKLESYFSHMALIVVLLIMILIVSEGVFVRDEWKVILLEFGELETIFAETNFDSPKLSTLKKVLSILPALLYFGDIFMDGISDLYLIIRTYISHVIKITNYLIMIWFIIYCWNIKNHYRNLILYLQEIENSMIINKTKVYSSRISRCLQILNQLSKVNSMANKFFLLKISNVIGN